MSDVINKTRLANLLRSLQRSIDLFEAQGHSSVYFTAQFLRGGRKQNGIDRGDLATFARQIRTYVFSEEADMVRIEFIDEGTSKSIYSKVLNNLHTAGADANSQPAKQNQNGLGGFNGLGQAEVNELIDRRVTEERRKDEYQRMSRELDDLRSRNSSLETEKGELEETLKAKKDTEYYMGIIGAAFPGLAPLFAGTPLAQAANFLAGPTENNGNASPSAGATDDNKSIGAMISEFCNTLDTQQTSAIHLLFMAFEKDPNQIQRALQIITTQTPAVA